MNLFNIVGILGIVVALAIAIGLFASRYKIASATEAIIVTGRSGKEKVGADGEMTADLSGQKVVIGGGVFIWPFVQNEHRISLKSQTITISIASVPSRDGILLDVDGVAVIKVDGTQTAVRQAAQRFGGDLDQIRQQTQETLAGALRAIVGQMTVEEIIRNREAFAQSAVESAIETLQNQGLKLDTFQIQKIEDHDDYLVNLGRPQAAAVKRDAEIAEARATEESQKKTIAVAESLAVAQRELSLRKASIKAETDKADAQAASAKPLEDAAQRQLILEQDEVVEAKKAQVKERTLDTEIRRPADAERYRIEQDAEARKASTIANADASRQDKIAQAQAALESDKLRGNGQVALAEAQAKSDEAEARGRLALATAEAQAVELKGAAEAEAIRAKALAEAEGMEKKAEAFNKYGEAAILSDIVSIMPQIAREMAAPMANIKDLTVIDSNGANKLTQGVADNMAALPAIIQSLTGKDVHSLLTSFAGKGLAGPSSE